MQKFPQFKAIKQFVAALGGSVAVVTIATPAIANDDFYFEQWGKFIYHDTEVIDPQDRQSLAEQNAAMALLAISFAPRHRNFDARICDRR
jgi:hypothetical protein